MTVEYSQPTKGFVNGVIKWDTYCNIYDFTKRTSFEIKIKVDDVDECNFGDPDYTTYNLNVNLPGNADPIIDTDLTNDPQERKITGIKKQVFETLEFNVFGKDLVDNDFLTLKAQGKGFNMSDYGMSFTQVSGNGSVESKFKWDLTCSLNPKTKSNFVIQFLVIDNANKCRFYKADTVEVEVELLKPDNAKPSLLVEEAFGRPINDTIEYVLGKPIQFNFFGTDADTKPQRDLLTLTMIDASGNVTPQGYTFEPRTGRSPVQSFLSWNPDCSIFKDGVYQNRYSFKFRLGDDRCHNLKADTVTIRLKVVDGSVKDDEFVPPNVFTPNGDGVNDYFAVEGIDPGPDDRNYDLEVKFPADNCFNQFESVRIFNRWGTKVFESTDRKFRWYATNQPAGVYYYIIGFTHKEYKGSLSVRY